MKQPPVGLCVKGKVVNVVDGDTVDVEITKRIRVRLIGDDGSWFNTPELHSKDEKEKAAANFVKDVAKTLVENREVVLFVPASERDNISDDFTLSRVLGKVFVEGEDLVDILEPYNIGKVKK